MTKHKWHKEIKAWADGANIEYRVKDVDFYWYNASFPAWDSRHEYRIKDGIEDTEETGKDVVKYLYAHGILGSIRFYEHALSMDTYIGKIKLE